jgi:hypothetical protein
MLSCLISIIIAAILALIIIFTLEFVFAQFLPLPPNIMMLIRVLVGLLIILYALSCLGFVPLDRPLFRSLQ